MASTITSDSELEEGSSSNLNVSPLKRGRSSTSHADCDDDDHEDELSDADAEEIASKRRFNGAAIYKTKYQQSINYISTFPKLAKVALVIPHSNADEERIFSMVTKNKTVFRSNLKLDGTLGSILKVKLANSESCTTFEPPSTVLETAKKVTRQYNRAHKN